MNQVKKDLIVLLTFLAILLGAIYLSGCIATVDGIAKDVRATATYIDDHIEDH